MLFDVGNAASRIATQCRMRKSRRTTPRIAKRCRACCFYRRARCGLENMPDALWRVNLHLMAEPEIEATEVQRDAG
jgi:hypothetical protein